MGSPPKFLLVLVTVALLGCAAGGFSLGFLQTQPRRAVAEEEAPIAAKLPAGAVIKDAQPIVEPPPPPPRPKAPKVEDPAASDMPPSDTPAAPKPAPPPSPAPSEAAPGAPPGLAPAPPKLPDDLPPT
jgi:hypothetical protein